MKNQNMGVILLLLSSASAQSVGSWYAHFPMWSTQEIPAAKKTAFGKRFTAGNLAAAPAYNGNYSDAGYSCIECIMAGNVWCSRQWYYELPFNRAAYQLDTSTSPVTDPSGEFGQCCYGLYENNVSSGYEADSNKFNEFSCPARKSGSPAAGSWWCSDANVNSPELAIATCRQQKQICGDALIGEASKPYQAFVAGTKNIEG